MYSDEEIKKKIEERNQKVIDAGYEDADIVVFDNPYFFDAFIGISEDGRAVYDYDLMIESAMLENDWSVEESIEWIDFNTIRALPYVQDGKAPIILHRFLEV